MSSPLPEDPYAALGVSKDADLGQIRTAHRKLALKYHPDRIKGDDVDEKNKAKDEFQKAQQAYELLADASRRSRYDDQVRLAELQRERMTREASRPTGHTRSSSTTQTTFVKREMRKDGHFYEERAPPTSYFDDRDLFDDPIPRSASRKHEASYEKERKSSMPKTAEKKEKASPRSTHPVEGFTMRASTNLKAKAAAARERVHAKTQESKDREKRRERSEKHAGRKIHVEDGQSDSDDDTVVQSKQAPRSARHSPPRKPDPEYVKSRPPPVRRGAYYDDEESFDEDDKSVRDHHNARTYIAESQKRPTMGSRQGSDAYVYWGGDYKGTDPSGARSSDSEKVPSSRRTKASDSRARPSMPGLNSAPGNLRSFVNVEERAPPRARTNAYPSEREARPVPNLSRAHTMPVNKPVKKDSAPVSGSKLKHSETQDSGYYSSSSPVTPEMKGESPPPTRENSKKKGGNSVKYQIVTPDLDDDERVTRVKILDSDDENRHRRYRSPEPEGKRDKDRDRERERERGRDKDQEKGRDRAERDRPSMRERPIRADSDSRIRPSRDAAPTSYPRGEFARHDTSSPRGSPPHSRSKPLFGEVSSDEKEMPYSYRYDPNSVKRAAYQPATTAGYGDLRFRSPDVDCAPRSAFTTQMRYNTGRRPSAAY